MFGIITFEGLRRMKTNIKLANIDFSYDANTCLIQGLSLDISEGDIIGIKGPSGSGKTTLFRLILGFETPDNGVVSFNGKPLEPEHLQHFRTHTAWLPQQLDLGEGKVEEVFYYPFGFKANALKKTTEDKVLSTFARLGLSRDIWGTNFRNLSTGQRQRVGIALIHLLDKAVYLLDEPTSALDEVSKEKIKELLFDKKRIIISTSHDPWWLERCTQIIDLAPK